MRPFLTVVFLISNFILVCNGSQIKDTTGHTRPGYNRDSVIHFTGKQSIDTSGVGGDSVHARNVLAFALKFAEKYEYKNSFTYNSQSLMTDSGRLSMDYGYLFDKQLKYLIVRVPSIGNKLENDVGIYLYLLKNNHFARICSMIDQREAFTGDTLEDVNGDGYKDLVISWYSGCGCCPRADVHVFLYKPDVGVNTEDVALMNPTFLPGKKLVYTMSYGHPDEIALYKCKWSGVKLDTLESVVTAPTHKNKLEIESKITGKTKTVNKLPAEYRCMSKNDLEWFLP